jgi:hypothetical protein
MGVRQATPNGPHPSSHDRRSSKWQREFALRISSVLFLLNHPARPGASIPQFWMPQALPDIL